MLIRGIPPGKIIMLLNVQHKQAVNFFFRQSLPLIQVIKRIIRSLRFGGTVILIIPAYGKINRQPVIHNRLVFAVPL